MGSGPSTATEALIKFQIENIYLEADPAPELIFHQLITNIKGGSLTYLTKFAALVESNGGKYLEGILFLDQGQFQMFTMGANFSAIAIVHHIL